MGGGSSTQRTIENASYNRVDERESDESFHVIADKFGYYDSTDSEISELHFNVNYSKTEQSADGKESLKYLSESLKNQKKSSIYKKDSSKHQKDSSKNQKDLTNINYSEESESEPDEAEHSGKSEDEEKLVEEKPEIVVVEGIRLRNSEDEIRSVEYISDYTEESVGDKTEEEEELRDTVDSKKSSNVSQMSIERKYSREPPERDQNYEDNLKKSWCQCRNPGDCKVGNTRQQECTSCYQHCGRKNLYHSQNCPCPRPRTTYDLAKSAENISKTNTYNNQPKRGNQSHSSPEVGRNRLPMKSSDMINNDNSDYMYNDYTNMSTRSGVKNECYPPSQQDMKNRYPPKYPYEEPDYEYNADNHDRNCVCDICTRRIQRTHYRNCRCCECLRMKRPMEDQLSSYSDESQGLNLAYQKTEEYPVLLDEIENSISQRNKERVRRTMRQFELLSRQNKGLDKPIYDDDEEENTSNRFAYNKRCPPFNRPRSNEAARSSYCCDRGGNFQTRSDCLSERPGYAATPFPRSRGYVEKVARYMDPNMSNNTPKYPKFQNEYTNSRWQMDPRSGEWVKVYDENYDFERNYPPLPPTPTPMYRSYDNYPKSQQGQNYYTPSQRSASPVKHTMNKPCNCRNCMAGRSNNRY